MRPASVPARHYWEDGQDPYRRHGVDVQATFLFHRGQYVVLEHGDRKGHTEVGPESAASEAGKTSSGFSMQKDFAVDLDAGQDRGTGEEEGRVEETVGIV
jgi:hypothetical protein